MVTDKLKQLAEYQDKVEKLKQSVAGQLRQELASLYKKYGFESPQALIKAIKDSAGGRRASRAAKPAGARKRKRAKITPEMKQKLKSQVEAGKTGTEIAKALGISLPSVQNIKKELGLVKARKK
ncbi:MAG TPA: helix-turn-helix domain-containing protein [Opitutaceae bacterium]|nr:helix-turn-helix domain-containing protein [Opitutaceae bacterium]